MLRRIGRFLYVIGFIVRVWADVLLGKLLRHPAYEASAEIIPENDGKPNSPN